MKHKRRHRKISDKELKKISGGIRPESAAIAKSKGTVDEQAATATSTSASAESANISKSG